MYIYNVTTNIEESIEKEWLEWMKNVYIPEMLKTNKFYKALMSKVLVKEDMGGVTYSVQYRSRRKELLEDFYREDSARLNMLSQKFAGKFVAFQTELEVTDEQNSVE